MPTPAVFELDYVCKGRVQRYTSTEPFDAKDLPDGCSFRCRDNMTAVCRKEADASACTDPELAGVMRSQCAGSCGVCTGLGLVAEAERMAVVLEAEQAKVVGQWPAEAAADASVVAKPRRTIQ